MRRTIVLLALCLSAVACVPVTPPAAAPPFDGSVWHTVYTRPGWDGRATLDLRAVGDVMVGRSIAERAGALGKGYPFSIVGASGELPLLDGDLVLGNLESPLTERLDEVRPGPFRLLASPGFAPALHEAGFDALSLANNHALDAGPAGLQDAVAALSTAAIVPLGVGKTPADARAPRTLNANGVAVALLAFNAVPDPADDPAEGRDWGRAWLDDAAEAAVQAADASGPVVVLVHWGEEYQASPSAAQREWAARLAAAGADLVIGTHPHVLQPIERVAAGKHEALVAYSLGNFVFDQEGRFETSSGAVLRVLLDETGVAAAAVAPVDSHRGRVYPLPPQTAEGRAILRALGAPRVAEGGEAAAHPRLRAWRWYGAEAVPVTVPRRAARVARPDQLLVDLRGDGEPLWVRLDTAGGVTVSSLDAPETALWRNEHPDWRVARIAAGDPNQDGRAEVLLLLRKPDEAGTERTHPFMLGYRGGRLRVIWGGSPINPPVRDLAVGDLDGDGLDELVLLKAAADDDGPAAELEVLTWRSWIFTRRWSTVLDTGHALTLQDLDGDGSLEIVVE